MITVDFCLKDYDEILSLQKKLVRKKKLHHDIEDVLLLGEHFHVITLGKRPQQEKNLKVSIPNIVSENIKVRKIQRGGFATYHGPGQLVGYPIFDLRRNNIGVKEFIDRLEKSIILALKEFNIHAERKRECIGVWVNKKKVASIGVGVKGGMTFHGFALNINTDLTYFDYIVPCGLNNVQMTSIEKVVNEKISLKKVKKIVSKKISLIYNQNNCFSNNGIKSILK